MKILVTAGPTREMIDQVRFLSNLSSGKTGFAIAESARAQGHDVTLIAGPVNLDPPAQVKYVPVISAADMHEAVLAAFDGVDAVIMSAAVADYRPATVYDGKMKKAPGPLQLDLVRTSDILADLGKKKTNQILVGFALEVADPERNARGKLERKNLDLIVLNGPGNFGSPDSTFQLIDHETTGELRQADKSGLGRILVEKIESMREK